MKSIELYKSITDVLKKNNIDNESFIAKELILFYYAKHFSLDFNIETTNGITIALNRVLKGEPLAYVFSQWDFMSKTFYVDKNVLIPRSDTEILVQNAIDKIRENNYKTALDVCTGSGCIAISIALSCTDLKVLALDISKEALIVANKNNEIHKTENRVSFIRKNVLKDTLQNDLVFDIIVSNPPYIKNSDVLDLDNSVIGFEPTLALRGGIDGLDFYNAIAKNYKKHLSNNGYLIFECGYDNAKAVADILKDNNYYNIQIIKDLAGRDRVVSAKLKRSFNE